MQYYFQNAILDALYPFYYALKDKRLESKIEVKILVQAAKDCAEKTRNLEARAGRARYVQGKGAGK